MKKAKNRTAVTVTTMFIVALAILSFYFYWSYRSTPMKDTSNENKTEAQKLIAKDLTSNYPPTSREVVKLFGNIMKNLYDNVKDEDAKPLALKIRELYDKEFLDANQEETYLQNLYSDIVDWKDKNRRIASYLLVNDDLAQQKEVDEVQYATEYISFIIQENKKFKETWKVMLRQDENKRWKILGWEVVPSE